jgi:uncharacterized protein
MTTASKIENYIALLPEKEQEIAALIREFIWEMVPDAEERFSFKLPFYHYYGMFCYINYQKKGGGIELAFCRGKDLLLAYPELDLKNRAMIAGITFYSKKEMNAALIRNLLAEAAGWQREAKLSGKSFLTKKPGKKN